MGGRARGRRSARAGRAAGLGVGLFLASTAAGAQAPAPISVPLSTDAAGRLVVPVTTADGRSLRFAIHTAIANPMVAASLAGDDPAALRLRVEGLPAPLVDVQSVPDEALVLDGHRVDGYVGLGMLGDVDVLLDAPGGRMLLAPVGRRVEWPGIALSEPTRLRVYHGVALRLEVEVEGHGFGATLDLARPSNVANAGAARAAGIPADAPVAVRLGGTVHTLRFTVADTPVLARWDPDSAGFVSFGAALASDCALSVSFAHQELRTCVR